MEEPLRILLTEDVATDAEPVEGRVARWQRRLAPWTQLARELRSDGFYERFPAKGQVERAARLHRELGRSARIEPTKRAAAEE
jgi:hypothetical protein